MYTLGDISRKSARICPEFEAVVFEGTRLTHRRLNDRVEIGGCPRSQPKEYRLVCRLSNNVYSQHVLKSTIA